MLISNSAMHISDWGFFVAKTRENDSGSMIDVGQSYSSGI
jgi:hypothetical protein